MIAVDPGVVGVEVPLFPVLLRIGSDPTWKIRQYYNYTDASLSSS